jgi:hypothetical protein
MPTSSVKLIPPESGSCFKHTMVDQATLSLQSKGLSNTLK